MKSLLRRFFFVIIFLLTQYSFGYFYHLCILETFAHTVPQYIVLLADYHDKDHHANDEQRTYLELLLVKHCNKNIKLIIEDLSSVNNYGRMMCGKYGVNCTYGVLGHLANKARSFGILVDNVEYRYCRVASIGPLINNITSAPYSFKSSCIPISSLYKEIINEIERIKTYNDGKKLNDFYTNTLISINNKLYDMHLEDENEKKTVADHCAQLKQKKYRDKLEELCIFDSGLIDINIIHSIVCCNAPIIFVMAGGSHIEQVKKILQKNRFRQVFSTPMSHILRPIDLTILNKIFD